LVFPETGQWELAKLPLLQYQEDECSLALARAQGTGSTNLRKNRMDRLIMEAWTAAVLCFLMPMATQAQDVSGCPISNAHEQKSWDQDCAGAIQVEQDSLKKAELLFRRAYVLNERQAYEKSLDDLNAACALVPHHVAYLHERAYTLNSLGRYREALIDLNEQASLEPQSPAVYSERALARTRLGDWEGALADRDREAKLSPDSVSALVARAQARIWLGQFEEAQRDLKAAAALPADRSPIDDAQYLERVSMQLEAWMHHSSGVDPGAKCRRAKTNDDYSQPTIIGDCTLVFLSAKTAQDKADALTSRSIAWLSARQSQHDATADREAAVALDPDNPDRHTNLGFAYLQERHSWGARQEFDRSINIRKTYMALAGRASAHYNLDEKNLAFRDAKESFEMRPNELALWLLGDLAKDKHDDASAKLYWMGAYHLGSRDDRLLERLRGVGVPDPAIEPNGEPKR
jgi:tetratricopeptide (TPR) repeat protein